MKKKVALVIAIILFVIMWVAYFISEAMPKTEFNYPLVAGVVSMILCFIFFALAMPDDKK